MYVHPGRLILITIADFGNANFNFQKHQKVGKEASPSQELVEIEAKRN